MEPNPGKILELETDLRVYTDEDYDIQTFSGASFLLRPRAEHGKLFIVPTRVVTRITLEDAREEAEE